MEDRDYFIGSLAGIVPLGFINAIFHYSVGSFVYSSVNIVLIIISIIGLFILGTKEIRKR